MLKPVIRLAMTLANRARWRLARLGRGPIRGVHAIVLTEQGQVVLVRLTYANGWHLPGGGRGRREPPEAAMLRELRQEIGLTAWRELRPLRRDVGMLVGRLSVNDIFLVRDAAWRPRWSLEIAEARPFSPGELPPDVLPWTRALLDAYRAEMGAAG